MTLRVFVVSPVPWARAGLRAMFDGLADVEVVGEAASLETLTGEAPPGIDVLVVEAHSTLPGEWAEVAPGVGDVRGVVVIGSAEDGSALAADPPTRAWAYLSRQAGTDQIVAAVRAVAAGLVALEPSLAGGAIGARDQRGVVPALEEELTGRECEVLQLVALGLPNKTIGQRLTISEHTVKFHVASIMAKLGAGSRTEAVHLAARRGLVAL